MGMDAVATIRGLAAGIGRRTWCCMALAAALLIVLAIGCSQYQHQQPQPEQTSHTPAGEPVVRVKVLERQTRVSLAASRPPRFVTASDPQVKRLNLSPGVAMELRLDGSGSWMIGGTSLGSGELTLTPSAEGSLAINGDAYRGSYHLVPIGSGQFDVVNHVGIEGYLKSVVPREMLRDWEPEAYKAQAIAARTYALYEARTNTAPGQSFDLFADVRSQVYGGIKYETDKSRKAVDDTAGIVVVYGPAGGERIFKAYFSACCGGISQSAYEAFGDAWSEPLSEQNVGATCNISPSFNWGPVTVPKDELTRRLRGWGASKNRPEKDAGPVAKVRISAISRVGRPVRFEISDARGNRYLLKAEELRWAVNFGAKTPETRLKSSFCKPVDMGSAIQFVEGHGSGHGVGLCQWCCQARALAGWAAGDMVVRSYPGSKLARAY